MFESVIHPSSISVGNRRVFLTGPHFSGLTLKIFAVSYCKTLVNNTMVVGIVVSGRSEEFTGALLEVRFEGIWSKGGSAAPLPLIL